MKLTWQKKDHKQITVQKFLLAQGISQRLIKTMKKGVGTVYLEQKPVPLNTVIKQPVAVTLELPPEKADENVPPSSEPLEIYYEDSNWLVVNKPAGVTSVPGPSDRQDTMVNRVKGYLLQQGATDLVPHVITRLDRFTSGVMLIAKHRVAQGLLTTTAAQKQIHKEYYALVSGELIEKTALIDAPLGRKENSYAYEIQSDGKNAQTKYQVVQDYQDQGALVQVQLLTGRTHQIRAHFTSLGHPLYGDELYQGPQTIIQRQALHAYKLQFVDPFTRTELQFISELPADFKAALAQLDARKRV